MISVEFVIDLSTVSGQCDLQFSDHLSKDSQLFPFGSGVSVM